MIMTTTRNYLFRTIVTVPENQRALVLQNGKFKDILRPGRHVLTSFRSRIDVEVHDINQAEFRSTYETALFTGSRVLADAHFTEVRTSDNQVAIVTRDGRLHTVVRPDAREVYWTDAGPWSVEHVDVSGSLAIDQKLAKRLAGHKPVDAVKRFNVEEGQAGLLYVDNAFEQTLKPGAYAFWNIGRPVNVKVVDVREHAIEVTGQEILTRDRVSVRVNITAAYRVADPVKAASKVKDFNEALYRALQHGFRQSFGTKTLDQILADKVSVDSEAARTVREQMAAVGIKVGDIAVKDVILPGEVREILNQVVAAEKEAEANVIRRREETNATRSLLNTAKVMAENPVMLRLKELEALEKVAGKVQYLAVHNGTQGLLDDLVNLRGDDTGKAPKTARKRA